VRKFLLGSRTKVEAELARSVYGSSMPLAGLYCYGEIGPVRGAATSRFLNETFVSLLLGT
jgi:small ligand-binding sensory domain FIST